MLPELAGLALFLVTLGVLRSSVTHTRERLHGCRSSSEQDSIRLQVSPSELTRIDIAFIILCIFRKYLPGSKTLVRRGDGFALPFLGIEGPVRLRRDDFTTFNHALSGVDASRGTKNDSGSVNPLFLVALTTPLIPILLSHPTFPVKAFGAVNTRNTFYFADAALCSDPKALLEASNAGLLSFAACVGGSELPGRRKRRGMEFEVVSRVLYEGKTILTQRMFFLQFLSKHAKPVYEDDPDRRPSKLEPEIVMDGVAESLSLHVGKNAPSQWAASCRDYNPIHVSNLAAKAFGFTSKIAHGNHVVAMMLHRLLAHRTASCQGEEITKQPSLESLVELEVAFQAPVTPLPLDLQLTFEDKEESQTLFAISKGPKRCMAGSFWTSST
ncbi:MAG: hypothetical protein M1828_001917 [Chrysothrix sp. TS-e1954]|nr:MAG: hypothetical protein M1828_001917 [Chrysothrix sp. TS-e1954]